MTSSLTWHTLRPSLPDHSAGAFLVIHGWLGSSRDWGGVASELPPGYHLVAVDLPGHGETPQWPREELTFSTICDALATMSRAAFGGIRPLLVGYSLGGRIALQLAQAKPELFSGLVLIAAHPGLSSEPLRAARRTTDEERAAELTTLSFEQFIARWYAHPPFSSLKARPELLKAIFQERLAAPPSSPAPLLTALSLGNQPSPPPSLSLPTLLIAGGEDPAYCEVLTQFSNRVGARSVIVPDAGHALLFEAPAAISRSIVDFSDRLTPTFPPTPSE